MNDIKESLKESARSAQIAKTLAVWLIMKDGHVNGRIIAKTLQGKRAVEIMLEMHRDNSIAGRLDCYRKIRGRDNLREKAIGEILNANTETLKAYYGINLLNTGAGYSHYWKLDFENGGYQVIQVV